MVQRQCPECDGELVLASRRDNQQDGSGSEARPSTYWRCSICGGAFTADQLRANKRAKQLDNATT